MDMTIEKQDQVPLSFHLTDDHPAGPKELLRVERDGRFYVDGKEIETSEEVRDTFARWCRHMVGGSNLVTAARDVLKLCDIRNRLQGVDADFLPWPGLATALGVLDDAVKAEDGL